MAWAAAAAAWGWGGARRPPTALLVAGGAVALLTVLPLGWVLVQAAGVGAARAVALLWRPLVGALLVNTLTLVLATTLAAAVLGTAAAWFVERTRLPGRRLWGVLAAVPLAIPAFVASYAWVSWSSALQDFAGALLVLTLSYFPLIYLPVAAALRGLDPALEETARALGLGPWRCFWRVVLPQLRPALLGGMLLLALHALVEFGAFALLRFRTFTTEIYAEYRIGFGGPNAALLALILVALCLLCLLLEARVRGGRRYARLGRSAQRATVLRPLGSARWPVCAAFGLLAGASIGVPVGTVFYWLTQHSAAATATAGVSLPRLLHATLASVELGAAGALATVALALPLSLLATRHAGWLAQALERAAFLAQGMPGIVIGLALVSLTVQALRPLYQSAALLVLAYAILFLPLALVSVRAALEQSQRSLEESGRALGLGWASLAWRVTLPLAAPGLGAAAALVFVSVVTELTTTLLLVPIGTRTLATQVWANTSTLAFAAAAPYAATMLVISVLSSWLLARRAGTIGLLAAG